MSRWRHRGATAAGLGAGALVTAALVGACANPAPEANGDDRLASELLRASFRGQGSAGLDRLTQDELQKLCSAPSPPPEAVAKRLEAEQLATVRWPADGRYLGDWRQGEALAQNGRGMTWSDPVGVPAGGNCYNCHQIAKAEIAYGTLGPSLYQYGRLRGVVDPAAPAAEAVVRYTWGKLWNAKAYNACSSMPRFGHAGVLTEPQLRDLMALLLDPTSPVNAP